MKPSYAPTRHRLSAALLAALVMPFAGQALAQQSSSDAEKKEGTQTLDKVQVVGSRIKRAEIEGPTAVTVITREDIDREGFQSVADML